MTKKSKKRLTSALIVALIVVLALSALVGCTDGEKTQVTITFKDGDQVVKTVIIDKDAAIAESQLPTDPTKEGFEFLGWFNGETKFVKDATFAENVTFEAKFEALELLTVTFVNGETTVATVEVYKGHTVATADIPANPEAEEGEFFAGWFNDEVKFVATEPITADVTFTAVFKALGKEKGLYEHYMGIYDNLLLNGDGTGTLGEKAIEYVIEVKDVVFCEEVIATYEVVTADMRIILVKRGENDKEDEGNWAEEANADEENVEEADGEEEEVEIDGYFFVNDGNAGTYTCEDEPDLVVSGYGQAAFVYVEDEETEYDATDYVLNADGVLLLMPEYLGIALDKETMTYSVPETDDYKGMYMGEIDEVDWFILLDGLGSAMASNGENSVLYGTYKVEGNTLEIAGLDEALDGVYTLELDGALLVSDSIVFANAYIGSIEDLHSGKYYSEELGTYIRFIQKEVDEAVVYGLKIDLQNYWGTVTDHGYAVTVSAPHSIAHFGGEIEGTVEFKVMSVMGQLVLIHECEGEEVAVVFYYNYGWVSFGDAYVGTWTAEDETQVEIDWYSVYVNGNYGSELDSYDELGLYTFVLDGVEYVVALNWDGSELMLAALNDDGTYANVKHLTKAGAESGIPAEFFGTWTGSYLDEESNEVEVIVNIDEYGVSDNLGNISVSFEYDGYELCFTTSRGENWYASINGGKLYYSDQTYSVSAFLTKEGPVMPTEYLGVWTGTYQDNMYNDVNVTVTITNDGITVSLESFTWSEVLNSVSFEIDPIYSDVLFVTDNDENWTIENMYGTFYLKNADNSVYVKLTAVGGDEPAEPVEVPEEFYGVWYAQLVEQYGETVYTTDYAFMITSEEIVFGLAYDGEDPYYLNCTAKSYDAETKKLVVIDSNDSENWLILNDDGTIQLQDGYSGGNYLNIALNPVNGSEEA